MKVGATTNKNGRKQLFFSRCEISAWAALDWFMKWYPSSNL
ncbi:MAG: hypothetical protein ABL904_20940 [Hyphomicrobiaceae bacterium]